MDQHFIEIEELTRHYMLGDNLIRALDGVTMTIDAGEFLCLMGPSGSGKSTLMNMLGGLDQPDSGSVKVKGREIGALDQNEIAAYRQQQVGFVFQSFNLIPTMTALQNVAFPLIFSGVPHKERDDRAAEYLTRVGLGDRMDHKPTELSGGQQQRVALARAMVNRPTILLGDEPTGNLDSKTGIEILDLFKALNEEGQTIIVVTHDPRLADYATRTIHLLDGKIVNEERAPV